MADLENHLEKLGYRGAEHDLVCWRVTRVGGSAPTRHVRQRPRTRLLGRDLYTWFIRTTETPAGPYRVTRAG